MTRWLVVVSLLVVQASVSLSNAQNAPSAAERPSPELARLAAAFVGDWDTTESMERSEFFPKGGGRRGISHWRLGVGGTTLIGEGHSDGSVGPLDHLIVIWWNKNSKDYGYYVCFRDTGSACFIRGSAHWEGNNFVNDYEEVEHGKKTKWRDSFIDITPNSHTLIAARAEPDGSMKTLITTRSTRRR